MAVSDAGPDTAQQAPLLRTAGDLDEEREDGSEGGRIKRRTRAGEGICDVEHNVNQVGGGAPDPGAIPLRSLLPSWDGDICSLPPSTSLYKQETGE